MDEGENHRAGQQIAAISDRSPDLVSTNRKNCIYALDNSRYFNSALGFRPFHSRRRWTDSHTFGHSHHCDCSQLSPRPNIMNSSLLVAFQI